MNIKIQAFQALFSFWFAHALSDNSEQQSVKDLSREFETYIKAHTLPFQKGISPYDEIKKLFVEKHDLENDFVCLHKEVNDMVEEIEDLKATVPHVDFLCALNFMKYGMTKIFNDIAGVEGVEFKSRFLEWPFRIQQVRREFDEYDEVKPGRIYDDTQGQYRKRTDNSSFKKWYTFVTEDPSYLSFTKEGNEHGWRTVAKNLQGNMSEYFHKLDPKLRELRYNNDRNNFSITFSAIIQRGYRLACYFEHSAQHKLDKQLKKTFLNGTSLFFGTAFRRAETYWYFPMEHIDMYNIVINSTRDDPNEKIEPMFVALKLPDLHDHYIIPGRRGCSKTPYVGKYEKKYSTKLTPPI